MYFIYIIYSASIDKYYVGHTVDVNVRLNQHNEGYYDDAFTSKASDWELFYYYSLESKRLATSIEFHIKSMKSKKYYHDLKKYPEIMEKLILRYN